jgi:HPt (histidine-containing phosphotransfer) domain-containing protein
MSHSFRKHRPLFECDWNTKPHDLHHSVLDSLPEIESAVDKADAEKLSDLAHWIKGTGGTVGLNGLTEIGRELHALAKSKDFFGAYILILELQAILVTLRHDSQHKLSTR